MAELFRDIQCGMDVGRMVELGRFDKEFTVYGCAYQQDGESYYRISEHAETIYRFYEHSSLQQLYPGTVVQYQENTSVSAGAVDDIWREVQWRFGHKLAAQYSDAFLKLLDELGNLPPQNDALPLLEQWQEDLEGHFQRDWLQLFDRMTDHCLQAKLLNFVSYQALKQWSDNSWKQMEDDVIIKDTHERTLHGFAYQQNGKTICKYDAQYTTVYQKKQQFMGQGYIVTPIYSQTYWFKNFTEFLDIKKQYCNQLQRLLKPCLRLIQKIYQLPTFLPSDEFKNIYQNACNIYNAQELETLKLYGYHWNCLK